MFNATVFQLMYVHMICSCCIVQYIKDCFQQQKSPQLTPVKKEAILSDTPVEEFVPPQVPSVKRPVGKFGACVCMYIRTYMSMQCVQYMYDSTPFMKPPS